MMTIGEENSGGKKKTKFWQFALKFSAIIIAAFLLIWGLGEYRKYEGRRQVDKLAEALKRAQEEDYNRAMADTYGGKTPQETLQMYIEAVEKGDYELASKYLIESHREREIDSLNKASGNLSNYLTFLKEAVLNRGDYSADGKEFNIEHPFLIRMKKYPNGIWKIIEI